MLKEQLSFSPVLSSALLLPYTAFCLLLYPEKRRGARGSRWLLPLLLLSWSPVGSALDCILQGNLLQLSRGCGSSGGIRLLWCGAFLGQQGMPAPSPGPPPPPPSPPLSLGFLCLFLVFFSFRSSSSIPLVFVARQSAFLEVLLRAQLCPAGGVFGSCLEVAVFGMGQPRPLLTGAAPAGLCYQNPVFWGVLVMRAAKTKPPSPPPCETRGHKLRI